MATTIISKRLSSKTFNPTNYSHLILPSHLLSKTPNPTSSQTPLNPPPCILSKSLSSIITKDKDHNFIPSPTTKNQSLLTQINPIHDLHFSWLPNQKPRYHSTSGPPHPSKKLDFKHQEIEGPTLERDMSSMAKETREVLEAIMKNLYRLSWVVALVGLFQLGLGAWISYATKAAPMVAVSIQSAVAFGFPCALAFMMRQSLKPMNFFKKMKQMERRQILTLTMQVAKQLNLMFVRVRGASEACVVGMSAGMLYAFLSN